MSRIKYVMNGVKNEVGQQKFGLIQSEKFLNVDMVGLTIFGLRRCTKTGKWNCFYYCQL